MQFFKVESKPKFILINKSYKISSTLLNFEVSY